MLSPLMAVLVLPNRSVFRRVPVGMVRPSAGALALAWCKLAPLIAYDEPE